MEQAMEIFVGRLGRNPELKYTPKGKAVCYLSVAVNKNKVEKPEWKKVVVWEKQAEQCNLFLKKGSEIFVQGQSRRNEFTNNEGEKKSYEEVNARLVGFPNI